MRPYRIRHVIDSLGPGGAERLLCAYAPRLEALGLSVDVVVLQERGGNPMRAPLENAGIRVTTAAVNKLSRLDQLPAFHRAMKAGAPDLLHTHLEFSSLLGALSGAMTRTPVVGTLHTLHAPATTDRGGARRWLMYQAMTRFADRVICLTEGNARIARQTGLGRARIEVLPNGVEVEVFDAPPLRDRATIRAEFAIPVDAPLIVTVCVLRPEKGIDHLLSAMPQILRANPEAHLLVVGDGPEMPRLTRQASRDALTGRVHFAGHRSDVSDILRAADVFVLPTLFDAQPTVIMEAMAARLPVVSTLIAGVPDMIDDGKHGLLVAPGDVPDLAQSVSGLLALPAVARSLGAAGRERAEVAFSMTRQVERLAQLYDRLIFDRRRAR